MDEFEFSIAHVNLCSGSTDSDRAYAKYFCKETIKRAQDAAFSLRKVANLETTSLRMASDADSLMIQIVALSDTIAEQTERCRLSTSLQPIFADTKSKLEAILKQSRDDFSRINGWVNHAREIK